ncbi:hypothetical protein JR316_0011434 [Psilocybe cubensis]|uniref:Uncharacterized protein n=2 Tax=Psilocybe cubensis TaxID=181762 RepID=A0ACB8GK50_PSICU|nr:hypothetical protein JR316_0011434 [Psilocybe cubensis]KAH9475874.1 hypothetical protein JR316_0011434 [Psilocybe cubensis]
MSRASTTKKRRYSTAGTPSTKTTSVSRLNELLADALFIAENIDPDELKGPDSRKAIKLARSILQALPVENFVKSIGYNDHKRSLNEKIRALQKHCKRDWKDGYERQSEMMSEISEEIVQWLPELWRVMAEEEADPELIRPSLVLCSTIVGDIWSCKSRAEYGDQRFDINISGSSGESIYKVSGGIGDMLVWMWRELLVISGSRKIAIDGILDDIEQFEKTDKVFGLLQQFPANGEQPEGNKFWDKHWNQSMKDFSTQLCERQYQERIAEFQKSPTIGLYRRLVSQYPTLKKQLITFVRENAFSKYPAISYSDAAEIFMECKQTKALLRILDITTYSSTMSDTTLRAIVKYLSTQTSKEIRARGLKILEFGLKRAKDSVWNSIDEVFPGLDNATDWLEFELDDMYVTDSESDDGEEPGHPRRLKDETKLKPVLRKFANIASDYPDGEDGPLNRDSNPMKGYDSDDSDYEEAKQAISPNLAKGIQDWVALLGAWPDNAEKAEVWDKVKCSDMDPWIVIDGALEELANRYVELMCRA